MKNSISKITLFIALVATIGLSGCRSSQVGMNNTDTQLQLRPFDLDMTSARTATATVTRVVGIDFMRLFNIETGNFSKNGVAAAFQVPVLGAEIVTPDQLYALRALIDENNGVEYDMVLYPKFQRKTTSFIVFSITETTVTARFAKLKN